MLEIDLGKEEYQTYIVEYIMDSLINKLEARNFFPIIRPDTPTNSLPLIHKDMEYDPETFEVEANRLTTAIANAEDK